MRRWCIKGKGRWRRLAEGKEGIIIFLVFKATTKVIILVEARPILTTGPTAVFGQIDLVGRSSTCEKCLQDLGPIFSIPLYLGDRMRYLHKAKQAAKAVHFLDAQDSRAFFYVRET